MSGVWLSQAAALAALAEALTAMGSQTPIYARTRQDHGDQK
jgi:hypothetical protein